MSEYGQFCPVAKAMEVLDERWTLLVVRELLQGSSRFNELRRGVPRMSPALLAKRLRTLERAGVVRHEGGDGRGRYALTECGRELGPVVEALGVWGVRWVGGLGDADLDPHLLFWDVRRSVAVERWPRGRTVVAFELADVPARASRWWFVVADGEADVCDADPGHEVAVVVRTTLRALTRLWRGDTGWDRFLAEATVLGPASARRALPQWFGQSRLAAVPRPQHGPQPEPQRKRAMSRGGPSGLLP